MAKNKKVEISLEEKLKKALVPVEEQPYKIPDNWVWTRLGEIGDYKKGPFGSSLTKSMFVEKGVDTVKVYEQKNAIQKDAKIGNYYITKDYFLEAMTGFEVKSNDIIVSCAGTIGETYILPNNSEKGIINQALMKISLKDSIEKSYYLQYFDYFLKEESKEKSKGTAMKNIPPFKVFKEFPFPLPPLNEQKRIVEKLDFLFEKTKKAKEIIEEIKVDIENRKISILDRAFKGVLTSKWRNENKTSDVRELLKSINDEKIKKWEEDCIQAEKDGNKKPKKPNIKEVEDMIVPVEEQPYKLPNSWVWVRLGDISEKISKGTTPRGDDGYTEEGVNFLRVENIGNNNSINLSNIKYISEKTHNGFLKRSILEEKDILISIAGTLGRTAIVKKEDLPANINQAISFVRLIDNNKVLENFIVFYLNSPIIKAILLSQVKVTAIPNLTLEIISDIKLPLPSLEEQQEIVRILDEVLGNENKVKELLELEERIDMLEKSILNKAFKGELGTQNGSDIPAIEVLKEIL
ncbi:restriction endonuclease subunit S [Fusobacterium nucleatum YWH7199]|uniref:restriction endonuclease subunit S n=1 Tax=Fusobacterium nucleatum TaxID=851 RepID=UPI00201A2AFD|nr:restriction endonuclease subunit S [Fusobacterium nucleatum]MCL4580614.1 restriction endonuclease subunit S [Fusobacterium nucleatum YWH7199]